MTLRFATAMAAIFVFGLGMQQAKADKRRIASLAPKGSAWSNMLEEAGRALERATVGRVQLKLYPGGVQGDEKDVVRKIKGQQLDGAALTTVGLSLIYPGIRVLQLPFLFETVEEVDYVRKKMWPYFVQKFKDKGFRLMYPGDVGWSYMYSNLPINGWSALRDIKFWAWVDDPIVSAFFIRLDLKSVLLGVPEVLSALKTDRIDGAYGAPLAAVALQWYTEIKYATEEPVAYAIGAMVIRNEMWDVLSPADKAAENRIGKKLGRKLLARVRKDNKRAKKAMKRSGVTFTTTPESMREGLESEAHKVWSELAGKVYTKAELDMVLKFRDEVRAKVASKLRPPSS